MTRNMILTSSIGIVVLRCRIHCVLELDKLERLPIRVRKRFIGTRCWKIDISCIYLFSVSLSIEVPRVSLENVTTQI